MGYEDELLTAMDGNGLNDSDALLREMAGFLARLRPATTYLSVPTSAPAEGWAHLLLRKSSIGLIISSVSGLIV